MGFKIAEKRDAHASLRGLVLFHQVVADAAALIIFIEALSVGIVAEFGTENAFPAELRHGDRRDGSLSKGVKTVFASGGRFVILRSGINFHLQIHVASAHNQNLSFHGNTPLVTNLS